jgi:hypothetical protein
MLKAVLIQFLFNDYLTTTTSSWFMLDVLLHQCKVKLNALKKNATNTQWISWHSTSSMDLFMSEQNIMSLKSIKAAQKIIDGLQLFASYHVRVDQVLAQDPPQAPRKFHATAGYSGAQTKQGSISGHEESTSRCLLPLFVLCETYWFS